MAVLDYRTGRVGMEIGLLAGLTTAVFYPGPGFAEVLDHQAARILLLDPENALSQGCAGHR